MKSKKTLSARELALSFALLGALGALGCEQPSAPATPSTPAPSAPPLTTPPAPDQATAYSPLDAQALSQLNDAQRAQLDRGKAAQAALAATLLSTVSLAMKEQGPAQAIEVCAQEAPLIAQKVAADHGLRIGRTSFKLRQPKNSAPAWAQALIKARHDQQAVLASADGRMAILSPIRLMEPCLKCHGELDALAPGVKEAIASRYPADEATGFKAGELRGWFWLELPATATP